MRVTSLAPESARLRLAALLCLMQGKHYPAFVVYFAVQCLPMPLRNCFKASLRVNRVIDITTQASAGIESSMLYKKVSGFTQ